MKDGTKTWTRVGKAAKGQSVKLSDDCELTGALVTVRRDTDGNFWLTDQGTGEIVRVLTER